MGNGTERTKSYCRYKTNYDIGSRRPASFDVSYTVDGVPFNIFPGGDKCKYPDDKDKFLDYYMDSIHFSGILQISAIKAMVKYKGQGAEYISCSFNSDDEDYKEGYVTLYFWRPAVEQDITVYIENQKFYERLLEVSENYIKKEPKMREELEGYLHQLKIELNV